MSYKRRYSGDQTFGYGKQPRMQNGWRDANLSQRSWETRFGGPVSNDDDHVDGFWKFSIATYNVLSQNLLEDNRNLYAYCREEYLSWEHRKLVLLKELTCYQPDIMCLQEIHSEHYEDFYKPELEKLGYEGHYKKRTGIRLDGCATFYKKDKFNCLTTLPVEYRVPGVSVLDRDNVGIVSLLQPIKNGAVVDSFLCIANTHLLFNPRRGDVKLAQLMMLFAAIDHHAFKPYGNGRPWEGTYHPTILCGDLNMKPFSGLYNFVRYGSVVCDDVDVGKFSGQTCSQKQKNSRSLEASFLCKSAGLTDQCQFMDIVRQRDPGGHSESFSENPEGLSNREAANQPSPSAGSSIDAQYNGEAANQPSPSAGSSIDAQYNGESANQTDPSAGPSSLYAQGSGTVIHKLGFQSVYDHISKPTGGQEVTTYHNGDCSTVDYIFYSQTGRARHLEKLRLLSRLKLWTKKEIKLISGLPNKDFASDHTILIAKFSLKI